MANYDFTACLSPLDFELLTKDLLEVELGIQLENFSEGRDKGIDLRYAPIRGSGHTVFNSASMSIEQEPLTLIVQCKRYSEYSDLKYALKNKELAKIQKLRPTRYILSTSVSLSPQQVEEIKTLLSPFAQSTGDIYGRERLNSLLTKHSEIERRHMKLWVGSAGVLDSIVNAGAHIVSREEVERTLAAAKIYVRNASFDEALDILKKERVCIISGLPGIGKTTLARMLLLYFHHRDFDIVKITADISEARAVGYHNRPRFYYYDDFLGQTAQADKLNKNEDQRLLDFMTHVRDSKDSIFVLTTREYILNQAKLYYEKLAREKFDHRTCIIDLSKYSRRIRAQILYNHLHFSKLPRAHLDALVSSRGYVQIIDHKNYNPRLIEYLTDSDWIGKVPSADYLTKFLRKLDNPVEIWEHAFRNQLSDRARHLLFILTTMPTECRIDDVEAAFLSFHKSLCNKFGIAHSSVDLTAALKELDGTFVATRMIKDILLIRFQNPSIRDFMQFLLLGGEMLLEVLSTLVFFEQAHWFVKTMIERRPQFPKLGLSSSISSILESLKRLVDSASCSLSIEGPQGWERVVAKRVNCVDRIATVGVAVIQRKNTTDAEWMRAGIIRIAEGLANGTLSASSAIGSIESFRENGYLDSDAGRRLVVELKNSAVNEPCDLDDFETLVAVVSFFPEAFAEDELQSARDAYSEYSARYASECTLQDPEELRNEAMRIGEIGDSLLVDTEWAQDVLKSSAGDIEAEQESRWDDADDDRRGSGSYEECSNGDLDSMFRTLND